MKFHNLLSAAAACRLAAAYLVAPPGTPAPGATSSCSEWVQQSYGLTCDIIEKFYGMTAAQFSAWNPSVTQLGAGCNLIQGLYYCVQVNYVSMTFLTTGPPTTSTTLVTSTTTSEAAPPPPPSPTQSGIPSACNKFYQVASGDTCSAIAAAQGIALTSFYAWNPAVGSTCASLWAGYYVCVGVAGPSATAVPTTPRTSTTTTAGNGVATPTPVQAGMAANCNAFHKVVSGDGCYDIAAAAHIALGDFYSWNPAVGNTCASLWAGYYVCVGVSGSPTAKPPPTTTKPGNTVATPTPTQAGMTGSCGAFHKVVAGDTCYDIAAAAKVALADFYSWNPAVGSSCSSLWAGYYVCTGVLR